MIQRVPVPEMYYVIQTDPWPRPLPPERRPWLVYHATQEDGVMVSRIVRSYGNRSEAVEYVKERQ